MARAPAKRVKRWPWQRAVRDEGPTGVAGKFVPTMQTLATFMDDGGVTFVSQDRLAAACRCSVRTIRTHLQAAADRGWLEISEDRQGGKGWRKHTYHATVPAGVARPALDAEQPEMIAAPMTKNGEGAATNDKTCGNERPKVRQPTTERAATIADEEDSKRTLRGQGKAPGDECPETDNRGAAIEPARGIRPNGRQPNFEKLLDTCLEAGVSGSDWAGQDRAIFARWQFHLTDLQHQMLQRQLNDRAGK